MFDWLGGWVGVLLPVMVVAIVALYRYWSVLGTMYRHSDLDLELREEPEAQRGIPDDEPAMMLERPSWSPRMIFLGFLSWTLAIWERKG